MIYTTAIYADPAHTQVKGTDANGQTETRPLSEPHEFRRAEEFITGFLKGGGVIGAYVVPAAPSATDQSITKRQIVAALILGGGITDPDAFIETAIATITDPTMKALALNDWRNAPFYVRSHPLFNDPAMLAAISMDAASIDGLWGLAVTLPA